MNEIISFIQESFQLILGPSHSVGNTNQPFELFELLQVRKLSYCRSPFANHLSFTRDSQIKLMLSSVN